MSVRILRHSHRSQTASISASTFVSTNPSPASRMLRALVYLGTYVVCQFILIDGLYLGGAYWLHLAAGCASFESVVV